MILRGKIVCVVGCGGKTSFIRLIAERNHDKKVLVSTTTKIFPITGNNIILKSNLAECELHRAETGIQCLGILNEKQKLEALPEQLLAEIVGDYDLVLLEADGSKNLPYKGWKAWEPVIPGFTQQTIGIVTLGGIGKPADESRVHRLPEFTKLTGTQKGEPITLQALEKMVFGDDGMFRNSVGEKTLVVNQVEDEATKALAESWLKEMKTRARGREYSYYYGSVRENYWTIVDFQ